jgi:hypothetical protein
LRKESNIEWTSEYEEVFNKLKDILSQPSVLSKPMVREILLLYLPISAAVSAILVREIGTNQCPIYFCSKALAREETRYKKIEKVSLALMVAAKTIYTQSSTTISPIRPSIYSHLQLCHHLPGMNV